MYNINKKVVVRVAPETLGETRRSGGANVSSLNTHNSY